MAAFSLGRTLLAAGLTLKDPALLGPAARIMIRTLRRLPVDDRGPFIDGILALQRALLGLCPAAWAEGPERLQGAHDEAFTNVFHRSDASSTSLVRQLHLNNAALMAFLRLERFAIYPELDDFCGAPSDGTGANTSEVCRLVSVILDK